MPASVLLLQIRGSSPEDLYTTYLRSTACGRVAVTVTRPSYCRVGQGHPARTCLGVHIPTPLGRHRRVLATGWHLRSLYEQRPRYREREGSPKPAIVSATSISHFTLEVESNETRPNVSFQPSRAHALSYCGGAPRSTGPSSCTALAADLVTGKRFHR